MVGKIELMVQRMIHRHRMMHQSFRMMRQQLRMKRQQLRMKRQRHRMMLQIHKHHHRMMDQRSMLAQQRSMAQLLDKQLAWQLQLAQRRRLAHGLVHVERFYKKIKWFVSKWYRHLVSHFLSFQILTALGEEGEGELGGGISSFPWGEQRPYRVSSKLAISFLGFLLHSVERKERRPRWWRRWQRIQNVISFYVEDETKYR